MSKVPRCCYASLLKRIRSSNILYDHQLTESNKIIQSYYHTVQEFFSYILTKTIYHFKTLSIMENIFWLIHNNILIYQLSIHQYLICCTDTHIEILCITMHRYINISSCINLKMFVMYIILINDWPTLNTYIELCSHYTTIVHTGLA